MFLPVLVLLATPAQFDVHLKAGVAALDRNNPARAEAEFEEAARLAPENAGAWLLLAQSRAKLNKHDSAIAAAKNAEKLGGGDSAVLQGLAHFYTETEPDLPRAAGLIVRYAQRNPRDRNAWRAAATLYLDLGRPEQAIAAASEGLAVENNAALRTAMGRAYAERKEWNKAIPELAEAVRLDPYDEDAQFRLAQTYLLQQDFASAANALLNAKKIFAASPQIELALGVAYYGLRDFRHAVDEFLTTMKLAPNLPQPYVFVGRILEHAGGRLPEVIERCKEYEARNPKSYLGYLLHAKALLAASPDAEGAFELLDRCLALKEDDAEAQYLLGTLLERKGDFAAAAAHLERSIALNATDAAPHFRLARVYLRLGRKEEAARQRALNEKLSEEQKSAGPEHLPLNPPGK